MQKSLYYTAPPDAAFEDMKQAALKVWEKYKNEPGDYYEGKVARVTHVTNVEDNFMYLIAMFDSENARECVSYLSEDTKNELRSRMIDGGNYPSVIERMGL